MFALLISMCTLGTMGQEQHLTNTNTKPRPAENANVSEMNMIHDMALIVSQIMIANKKVDDGVALPAPTTDPLRSPPARRPLHRRPLLHPGSRHLKHAGASINMREQVAMMMITLEPAGFSYSR